MPGLSLLSFGAESLSPVTGENKTATEWWDWSDASKWTPSVPEVAGNGPSVDINNDGKKPTSAINPGFSAGKVLIKATNPSEHVYFDVEGDASFSSLDISQNSRSCYGTYIRVLTGSTLTVGGDVCVSPSSAYYANAINFGDAASAGYNGSFHIGGNLNLSANVEDAWFNLTFQTYGTLSADGVVNMAERLVQRQYGVIWNIGSETTRNGGLQGSNLYGKNRLSLQKDITLTFTNNSGTSANWSGAIDNGGKNFNIVMSESAAGSQELHITEGSANGITLKGGTFYLSSASGATGTLSLDGGFYDAKGNGAKFAGDELASGGFIFETGALENGYKVSAGELSKSGTGKILVDFKGLYAPDHYGLEFVPISAGAVDAAIDLENAGDDFAAANLHGGHATFKWAKTDGRCDLSVAFSEVPEPAAFAAAFAAVAPVAALGRKRR